MNCPICNANDYYINILGRHMRFNIPLTEETMAHINLLTAAEYNDEDDPVLDTTLVRCNHCQHFFFKYSDECMQDAYEKHIEILRKNTISTAIDM